LALVTDFAERIAEKKVAERFASETKVERPDMMQSFIRHGLSQKEAVSETFIQM
jgi:hypothetical protein